LLVSRVQRRSFRVKKKDATALHARLADLPNLRAGDCRGLLFFDMDQVGRWRPNHSGLEALFAPISTGRVPRRRRRTLRSRLQALQWLQATAPGARLVIPFRAAIALSFWHMAAAQGRWNAE